MLYQGAVDFRGCDYGRFYGECDYGGFYGGCVRVGLGYGLGYELGYGLEYGLGYSEEYIRFLVLLCTLYTIILKTLYILLSVTNSWLFSLKMGCVTPKTLPFNS